MASVGKLAATVAHELNNPLSGILTYAKLVERELAGGAPSPEAQAEVQRYLQLIQSESSRCGSIVRHLMVFSRRTAPRLETAHLNEIVDRSLRLVQHHREMAAVRLEAQPLAGDDSIVCDPNQVEQALVALLVNAIEAMSGGKGGVLTVDVQDDPQTVEIAIRDTGVGIPREALPHIFEPFYSTKPGESGVGLGLTVVYGIVQHHGGTIDVDSAVGRGTTFRVRLPRRPPAGPAQGAEAPQGVT